MLLKSFAALSIANRTASVTTSSKPIIAVPKIGSYSLFLKENAAKHAGKLNKASIAVFARETSDKWKGLSDTEKQSYSSRAKAINERAMAEFMKKPESERVRLNDEAVAAKKKLAARRERAERRENWEKTGHPKRPANAFVRFVKERSQEGGKISSLAEAQSRLKKASEDWKGMSEAQKSKYVAPFNAEMAHYKIALDKWKHQNAPPPAAEKKAAAAAPTKEAPKKAAK